MFRRLRLALPLFAFLVFFAVATSLASFAQEIRVGVVQDQSGINSDISRDYLAGARTYFDHINSQGGIKGRKVYLVVKDDAGDPVQTVSATQELLSNERVDVLFGFTGDETTGAVAADKTFRSARIGLFAPLSGASVSAAPDAVFYVRPSYRDEANHIISHFGRLGISQFSVVAIDSFFGANLAKQIGEELKARDKRLVSQQKFGTDLRGLDGVVKAVYDAKPQVIIVAADTISMAEFVKRFRRVDKGITIVGFSTVNHRTLIEIAKPEAAAGTILTQVVPHPDLPLSKLQIEHLTLMKKYREEPPSHLTLEGFVAAKGLIRAIERAATVNRAGILTAMSATTKTDLEGMTLVFSPKQDRGSQFVDLAFLRKSGTLVQ